MAHGILPRYGSPPIRESRPTLQIHADVAIRIVTVWTDHFTWHKDTVSSQTHRSDTAQAEGPPGRAAALLAHLMHADA
jgi:hypothetical protein